MATVQPPLSVCKIERFGWASRKLFVVLNLQFNGDGWVICGFELCKKLVIILVALALIMSFDSICISSIIFSTSATTIFILRSLLVHCTLKLGPSERKSEIFCGMSTLDIFRTIIKIVEFYNIFLLYFIKY